MTTTNVNNIRSGVNRTSSWNNSAASTSVVLLPQTGGRIPTDLYYQVTGFSCVPTNDATLTLISGNSTNASTDKVLWETTVKANTRIDFAGEFITTAIGDALKITTNAVIGKFTLVVEHK
jgi:hypothetical protein